MNPGFIELYRTGELEKRARRAREMLKSCELCPRKCGVDRTAGQIGACGIGAEAVVTSNGPHFGEEMVLAGRHGSGTIFFTGCNLACVYCQNHEISHRRQGNPVSTFQLADMMIELQDMGCHNINWVTPTHQIPQILDALCKAAQLGVRIPIVYNCGGYESVMALKMLNGVVDVYMPDIKYGANEPGMLYSGVPDYWDRCRSAVREMHRQVGDLKTRTWEHDDLQVKLAVRGLLVRHLVLPKGVGHSEQIARFLARDIGVDTFVNVMAQYRPQHRASEFHELYHPTESHEYRQALEAFRREGIHRFAR